MAASATWLNRMGAASGIKLSSALRCLTTEVGQLSQQQAYFYRLRQLVEDSVGSLPAAHIFAAYFCTPARCPSKNSVDRSLQVSQAEARKPSRVAAYEQRTAVACTARLRLDIPGWAACPNLHHQEARAACRQRGHTDRQRAEWSLQTTSRLLMSDQA